MAQFLLLLTGALVVGAIVFGIAVLITGGDGLGAVEPDGRSVPLPVARPLAESDFGTTLFDTALRGYRMTQVDTALRRVAYDIGYKTELIQVLEAEIAALREGRTADADALRDARATALGQAAGPAPAQPQSAPTAATGAEPAGEAAVPGGEAGSADGLAGTGQAGEEAPQSRAEPVENAVKK